jgi:hypothetical protein
VSRGWELTARSPSKQDTLEPFLFFLIKKKKEKTGKVDRDASHKFIPVKKS